MICVSQFPAGSVLELEWMFRVMAAHEAGHQTLFRRFGVCAECQLEVKGAGKIIGAVTIPDENGLSRQEGAVVGWGGIVSECILGFTLLPPGELPTLTAGSVEVWFRTLYEKFFSSLLSTVDRLMIARAPDSLSAARMAFRILSSPIGSERLQTAWTKLTDRFRLEYDEATGRGRSTHLVEVRRFAKSYFGALEMA